MGETYFTSVVEPGNVFPAFSGRRDLLIPKDGKKPQVAPVCRLPGATNIH